MEKFEAKDVINGKFFSLWLDGDMYAEVKAASAESSLTTEKIPIAGQLGNGTVVTGAEGTGTITFHKVFSDLPSRINDKIKAGLPFNFDLISELNDPSQDGVERVMIEGCTLTKFKVIDADITKMLESTYDFSYDPCKVTYE